MSPHRDSSLLISEPPLQVLPSLAKLIGLNEAIFLQQLHYWLGRAGKDRDGRLWVYNTYEGWHEQFPFWCVRTIKRIVANLEARKLILTTAKYNKMPMDRTLWYAIDYEALAELWAPIVTNCHNGTGQVVTMEGTNFPMDWDKMSPAITRDYQRLPQRLPQRAARLRRAPL